MWTELYWRARAVVGALAWMFRRWDDQRERAEGAERAAWRLD